MVHRAFLTDFSSEPAQKLEGEGVGTRDAAVALQKPAADEESRCAAATDAVAADPSQGACVSRSVASLLTVWQAQRSSIPGGGAAAVLETEEQWFVLFEALRTGRKHAKRSLRLGDGALLESFVSAMASEGKSEMLKCSLLVCLQENSVLFLEHDTKNMERVCALLSKMLDAGSAGLAVQCQILVTVTCLLCELSVAARQQRLFEGFVELLLGTISRANAHHDAVLRAAACECLRELEMLYPGLFHQLVGNFAVFGQTEMSFAHASYVSLLLASLTHAVQHARATRFARFSRKGSNLAPRGLPQQPPATATTTAAAAAQGQGQGSQLLLPRPMIPFAIPLDAASSGSSGGGGGGGGSGGAADELDVSFGSAPTGGLSFSMSSVSASSSSSSLLFSPIPMPVDAGDNAALAVPESVVQEIRKCVSLLAAESAAVLCSSQLFQFVHAVLDLQRVAGGEAVPNELLRQSFFRLLDFGSPLLLQALLRIRLLHPALFEDSDVVDDAHIMRKLLACAHDPAVAWEMQSAALRLLQEFGQCCSAAAYHALWPELWPSVFDSYPVTAAKLRALVSAFAPPARPSPPGLLAALSSLAEFRGRPASSSLARAVFATLRLVLGRLPEQFDAVYRFLLDLLVYSPQFLANLTESLDPESAVTEQLLTNFNQLLCGLECAKLRDYVPLAELVCRVPSIDATLLLDRALAFLHAAGFEAHVAELSVDERWRFGNALLQLYRAALVVQSPARLTVWEFVCQGLFVLSQRFPDVEVRDRAHFMHHLSTHLEPRAVADLLVSAESASSQVTSDAADLFSGSSALKIPAPVAIARPFLCFERVASGGAASVAERWSWEQVCAAEDEGATDADVEAFLGAHPPAESEPLSVRLRLRFLTPAELEGAERRQERKAKGGSGGSSNARGKKKRAEDPPPPACILGATVAFAPHAHVRPTEAVEVAALRAGAAHELVVRVVVRVPLPAALRSDVEFSFVPVVPSDGWLRCVVARAPLRKVRLDLEDLFAELPDNGARCVTLGLARRLFAVLWERKGFAVAESVKRLAGPRPRLESLLLGRLRRFVVAWTSGGAMARVLIFLPPGSHLLLEVRFGAESTVVWIKTDLWQLVEAAELFLESVVCDAKQ